MDIHVIVFDFDGTLIDSNQVKRDAYFRLFPADDRHVCAIQDILSHRFEQSRYVILEEILRELGLGDADVVKEEVGVLADRYDRLVLGSAKRLCPEGRSGRIPHKACPGIRAVCKLYHARG